MKKRYYFSYGSNLNMFQMCVRCPKAITVTAAVLDDWQIEFRGVLTIVQEVGAVVAGAVWEISAECEKALDRYEGVKIGMYRKEMFIVEGSDGQAYDCLVYIMNRGEERNPSAWYLDICLEGMRDWDLPEVIMISRIPHQVVLERRTIGKK